MTNLSDLWSVNKFIYGRKRTIFLEIYFSESLLICIYVKLNLRIVVISLRCVDILDANVSSNSLFQDIQSN